MPNEETVVLRECPFCSGEAQDWFPVYPISADCDDAFIRCTNCDAEGPTVLCDMADDDANLHWPAARAQAITAWNTRAAAMGWRDIAEVREADVETAKVELASFRVERREVATSGRNEGVWNVVTYQGTICGGDYVSEHAARAAMSSLQARAVITAYLALATLPTPPEPTT